MQRTKHCVTGLPPRSISADQGREITLIFFPSSLIFPHKVIYLIRNPRDVLVSGYFFGHVVNFLARSESLPQYFEWFLEGNGESVLSPSSLHFGDASASPRMAPRPPSTPGPPLPLAAELRAALALRWLCPGCPAQHLLPTHLLSGFLATSAHTL